MRTLVTQTVFIPTNGIHLHAEAAGPEDGPLVVLLHGFPENWAGWINQIGPLARSGMRVVAPDQRGYNLSDKPAGVEAYQMHELVEDAVGIIDAFGRDRAVVIGHDWGAAVAWQVALRHPHRVEKLVILNVPHPAAHAQSLVEKPTSGQMLRSWYIYMFQFRGLSEMLLGSVNAAGLRAMLKGSSKPGTFKKHQIDRYVEAWKQPGAITAMLNWYRAAFRSAMDAGQKGYLEESHKRVTVPTLILWGQKDPALIPQLAEWSLKWVDKGAVVRFPQATHWVQHDEAERVNNRILDFLQE